MNHLIDFDNLKYFVTVARHKSISSASRELLVTQSAVSQSIKNLERDLDKTLFLRTARGMSLTEEGRILYEYAEKGARYFSEGIDKIMQNDYSNQTIRISCSEIFAKTFIFPKINKIKALFPSIKFNFVSDIIYQERPILLIDNMIDLALVKENFKICLADIDVCKISRLEYGFIYNPDYFTLPDTIKLNDIKNYPLILKCCGTNTKRQISLHNNKLTSYIQCGHDAQILQLVKQGHGIGYAPINYIDDDKLKIVKVDGFNYTSTNVVALCRQNDNFIKKIIDIIKKEN